VAGPGPTDADRRRPLRILVVNAGSSSLKLQVLVGSGDGGEGDVVGRHEVEGWDGHDTRPIGELLAEAGPVDAVGHRVVHGGTGLVRPTPIDDAVVRQLRDLASLAPLHQEPALAGIAAARAVAPDVPHVACFDTSYHATIPDAYATYALPAEWRQRWPLRRFGFHGLSHAYATRRAAELLDRAGDASLRVVTCHLGAGASLCASLGGRSVDTTMGFTPLEGLVMATRSGTVDPGLVLWLVTEAHLAPEHVSQALERSSGLLALAHTPDMRTLLTRRKNGDGDATLAFDVYVHRLTKELASMTASLGGIDAIAYTAGIGEHSPEVRAAAASRLTYLGLALDPEANTAATGKEDADISAPDAKVRTLVVPAREDLEIARQVNSTVAP
jgi:acetate kinase